MDVDSVNDQFLEIYRRCFTENFAEPSLKIIGGGKMARILVDGFLKAGCFLKNSVSVCVNSQSSVDAWKAENFQASTSLEYYASESAEGVILICLKPQVFSVVSKIIFEWLLRHEMRDRVVISVMAGISLETLHSELGINNKIARVMPNVACAVEQGTLLFSILNRNESIKEIVQHLCSHLGYCVEIPDSSFNAATALAGSGPAFIFTIIDALADGGVLCGLSRDLALKLAANTIKGSAALALQSEKSVGALKEDVCSPAGTTIHGIRALEKNGVRTALIEAIAAAKSRADELSTL